ncbi:MAG TPA: hypothetical protein VMB85_07925 [Bryobacteraceae bacterium]|nr:hypothetical protein [Bryobacteraceae bacterium]
MIPAKIPIKVPEIIQRGITRFPDQRSENPTVRPPMNPPRIAAAIRSETHISCCIGSTAAARAVSAQENNPAIPPTNDM